MTETMAHYVVAGPGEIHRLDEPIPSPGAGEVLVRIAFTALSPGSNLFVYRTGSYTGEPDGPTEALYMGSGTVAAVGPGVTEYVPGDRVTVPTGHQAYTVAPASAVHRIPETLDLRAASLAYLSGWAVSALHLGRYAAAETVVVVGQGLVGASAALVAEMMGARVLALDTDPTRAAFAQMLGLGAVAQPGAPGAAERMGIFLRADGPDLILEASGAWQGLRQAIELARDWTRIAVMGIYRQPPPPDLGLDLFHLLNGFPSKFHYQRLQIIGCGSDPAEILPPQPRMATTRRNLAYVLEQAGRGRLRLDRLVTHCAPAHEIEAVLARMAAGATDMVGVVLDWRAE